MMAPPSTRRRISSQDALTLWRDYTERGDVQARNRLVMTCMPLVKHIVLRKVRELPAHLELDDFISCGLEALIASVDRYDPSKGASFEQFAWTRIQGAVLDELRRQDWAPRSLRRAEREIAAARDKFTVLEGRRPEREELAVAVGMTPEELRRRQDDIAMAELGSLNTLVTGDDDSTVERMDTVAAVDRTLDPEHAATVAEAKARFRAAFDALGPREREAAVLLYVNNLTLREIGEHLGVSESRVCQIHAQLKRTLKQHLAADEPLFAAIA